MSATRPARALPDPEGCQRVAEQMLSLALEAGAEDAEVLVHEGTELEVKVRLGEPELVKEAGSRALGLRVLCGARAACTYTSDFASEAMRRLARETVELARLSEPDPLAALPERVELARTVPDLDLWDDRVAELDVGVGLAWARDAERAAREFDARVTNSDGATFGRVLGASALATSAGFSGSHRGSYASLSVRPICDDADGKKRNGYWWTGARHAERLEPPEAVGLEAARRTVAKLGARKIETCEVPVIFPPETARQLVSKLAGLASGGAIWRKSSYFADREGTPVASPLVTLVDDPLVPRAPGSRPYDGEGLPARVNTIVDAGVLRAFLCDSYAGRKLGRRSTGSAGRGIGGGPYVTTSNLILRPGDSAPEDLERVPRGLVVTELMGFGFNPVTGDFSQGAAGFWIDGGARAFPVSEVTISASFDDLWKRVDLLGRDLDARSSVQTPSFRVATMMVAGR